jgi:hypothetical protein
MSAVKGSTAAVIFLENHRLGIFNPAITVNKFADAGVIEKCDWASQGLDRAEG